MACDPISSSQACTDSPLSCRHGRCSTALRHACSRGAAAWAQKHPTAQSAVHAVQPCCACSQHRPFAVSMPFAVPDCAQSAGDHVGQGQHARNNVTQNANTHIMTENHTLQWHKDQATLLGTCMGTLCHEAWFLQRLACVAASPAGAPACMLV